MQCQASKKILEAYLDGEITLMESVEIEEHLSGCADCNAEMESSRALRNLTQNAGLRYAAPDSLKRDIRRSLSARLTPPLPAEGPQNEPASSGQNQTEVPGRPGRHWIQWPAMGWSAAAAACILLAGVLMFWQRVPSEQQIAAQVVDNHIRSMLANHLADVPSSDQHTVKPWFDGKTNFSPSVTDFAGNGFVLRGGRLDYLDNQTVAALVYQRRGHIINVFIYPAAENVRPDASQMRGFNVIHWAGGGMEYWLVSDLNTTELQELAGLLRG